MVDMTPQGTQEEGVPLGHEGGDANIRAVVTAMVIILSATAVVLFAMGGLFRYFSAREARKNEGVPALFTQRQVPPRPRLLPSPFSDEDALGVDGQGRGVTGNQSGTTPGSEGNSPGANASEKGAAPIGSRRTALNRAGQAVDESSDDLLPWDKMRVEVARDEAEIEAYETRNPRTGGVRIPVERAKEVMSGDLVARGEIRLPPGARAGAKGGTTGAGGASGQTATDGTGRYKAEARSEVSEHSGAEQGGLEQTLPESYGPVYTRTADWEADEHKMNSDSSGSYTLKKGAIGTQ